MLTTTDIANMAADWLDVDPIGNLDTDRSGLGKAFRRNYVESAKTVIREFPWNCATRRSVFPAMTLPTSFTLDKTDDNQYLYALPANNLGVIDLNGRPLNEITHQVETLAELDESGAEISSQEVLWCSLSEPPVGRYKVLISPADMDPHLAKAVSIELAMRCVMKAANSRAKMSDLESLYEITTRGTVGRVGGHQASSRENNPQRARELPSRAELARHGVI